MKFYATEKFPRALVAAAILAVFLGTACTAPSSRAEAGAAEHPHPAPLTGVPIVVTRIMTVAGDCTPEFENNNCGAVGDPGDICLAAGSGPNPSKANLKFVAAGPHANTVEFERMNISLSSSGTCPADYDDDFPDFTDCEYVPTNPGNVMQVEDHNHETRSWDYTITMRVHPGCSSVTLHPIIENGGGNSSSDDGSP